MATGKKTGGRQKGAKNKATSAKAVEIAESGLTPLAYMLKVLRDEEVDPDTRLDAAKAAARFVHPTLASIEHKGDDDHPIAHSITVKFVKAGGEPK